MRFKPCIDLHAGQVKQIVGSTLTENDSSLPIENFVSSLSAEEYARMYMRDNLYGGHIVMLGKHCEEAAFGALRAFPGGFHIGGGINLENAMDYINAGASHIIVTSFVFNDGHIDMPKLAALSSLVGKKRLVIDLSCRRLPTEQDGNYYVVTNKWTKFTDFPVTIETLTGLSAYCDEFLVHGVDVEGKRAGIESNLVKLLGEFAAATGVVVTYAGGVRSLEDLELVNVVGQGHVDCTVGSALDIFGGDLPYDEVLRWHRQCNPQV